MGSPLIQELQELLVFIPRFFIVLLLQLDPHPCNQFLVKLAAATVVQLQEQGGGKGLLTTRGPPWQRQHLSPHPRPLLLQEKPVHHISNTIPPCDILPTSFSHLRPHQGVAGSCLWEGRQDGLSHLAASTWTAHLHPHPPSH